METALCYLAEGLDREDRSLRCADAACYCLKGTLSHGVIVSHCPFVDDTAGIGITLNILVSIISVWHPSFILGLGQGYHMVPCWSVADVVTVSYLLIAWKNWKKSISR